MQAVANQDERTRRITEIRIESETFEEERFLTALFGMFVLQDGAINLDTKFGTVSHGLTMKQERNDG